MAHAQEKETIQKASPGTGEIPAQESSPEVHCEKIKAKEIQT
ncbi:MAG: hypothetical protein WB869_17195 [Candidatus Acidiferrales bacterium]